ncbi:uncharacterized protein METZ01_LOCUS289591, partial [marine metagenome]
ADHPYIFFTLPCSFHRGVQKVRCRSRFSGYGL